MLEHTRTENRPARSCWMHGIGLDRAVGIRSCRCSRASTRFRGRPAGLRGRARLGGAPTVAALAAAVEELGVERPHVAGNSLGGGIALELGRRGWAGSVCAISPIGFAVWRERAYARAMLCAVHGMATAINCHAELAYGGPGGARR